MRKKLLFPLLLLVYGNQLYSQKNIILYYSPTQSNVVGKTLTSYVNSGQFKGQAAFGPLISNNLRLVDESSTTSQIDEFKRNLSFGISKILTGKSVKNVKVEAYGVKVTNVLNSTDSMPVGSKFVMSALKADSVTITITKDANYKLSTKELLNQISAYATVPSASTLNLITLLDSANYSRSKDVTVVIKNSSVYYAITIGRITKEFSDKFFLSIATHGNSITLNSKNVATKPLRPKMSDAFNENASAVDISLITKMVNGKPNLFVRASADTTVEKMIPMVDDRNWNEVRYPINNYYIPGKTVKKYSITISAHIDTDGKSIVIEEANIYYPEWVLNALPEKDVNK